MLISYPKKHYMSLAGDVQQLHGSKKYLYRCPTLGYRFSNMHIPPNFQKICCSFPRLMSWGRSSSRKTRIPLASAFKPCSWSSTRRMLRPWLSGKPVMISKDQSTRRFAKGRCVTVSSQPVLVVSAVQGANQTYTTTIYYIYINYRLPMFSFIIDPLIACGITQPANHSFFIGLNDV